MGCCSSRGYQETEEERQKRREERQQRNERNENMMNNYVNNPDECYSLYLKAQFGKVLEIHGLKEDATMLHIQDYVEFNYGIATSKMRIGQYGIEKQLQINHGTWKFPENIPLKKLGIKPNDVLVWKSFYDSYLDEMEQMTINRKREQEEKEKEELRVAQMNGTKIKKKKKKKTKPKQQRDQYYGLGMGPVTYNRDDTDYKEHTAKTCIDLKQLLTEKETEKKLKQEVIRDFGICLQNRGWVLLNMEWDLNKVCREISESIAKKMEELKTKQDSDTTEWKKLWDRYGYIDYKDYKQVFRVLTGDIGDLLMDELPKEIVDDIKKLNTTIDNVVVKLIENIVCDENVFGFATMEEFMDKSNVTIINGFEGNSKMKGGMIDFVHYDNNMELQENSQYPMIRDNKINVESHTDPGLFSISFYSDEVGLEFYDPTTKEWIKMNANNRGGWDRNIAVLFCGETAPQLTNGKIKSAIHRVVFNDDDKSRFTAWYEACVDAQISESAIAAYNERLMIQNEQSSEENQQQQ